MAIFGVQFAISMIMATLLHKFSTYFSFGNWLLSHKLVRYLHPSDAELKSLAGISNRGNGGGGGSKGRNKKGRHNQENESLNNKGEFLVPKQLSLQLDSAPVQSWDICQLHFSPEWQRLLDLALGAILVYAVTEVYLVLAPSSASSEFNLSLVWCTLVLLLTTKVLLSLTSLYFKSEEAVGERSLCLSAGFFFFFLSMVVLIVDENILETGLEPAFVSFNSSARVFLKNQGIVDSGPASQFMCKLGLAFWSGIMGAFLTFPGLRFARMHIDALRYSEERPLLKMILNINFAAPLLVLMLWFKPIARDYFCARVWPGMNHPMLSEAAFESLRLWMIVGTIILRLSLIHSYLQAHLNLAPEKVQKMQKEAGRISNIDLQRSVARVFYYLCVVALQYIAPLFLCLFSALLLKTLGDYSWASHHFYTSSNSTAGAADVLEKTLAPPSIESNASLLETSQQFTLAFANLRQVFSPLVYRGVLGYATWWLCTLCFTTSAIGLAYHSYFQ